LAITQVGTALLSFPALASRNFLAVGLFRAIVFYTLLIV
jgi:hypothetical protein